MREDSVSEGIIAFTFFVSCVACFAIGLNIGETNLREEAVRAGVACYTNDASGKPQFKWKECK